jgi:hypothetical protein
MLLYWFHHHKRYQVQSKMKTSLIFSLLLSIVQLLCTVQAAYKVSGFTFNSELTLPYGIWKDPDWGTLYISEPIKHRVWQVDSADNIFPFVGDGIAGLRGDDDYQTSRVSGPRGIWGDGSFLYICDSKNDRLRLVKLDENKISTIAGGGSALPTPTGPPLLATGALLVRPHGVWVDPNTKVIYLSDESKVYTILTNGLIHVFAGGGSDYSTRFGIAATAVQLTEPSFIIGDGKGTVYISDSGNNMIRKVTVNGMTSVVAGFARSSAVQLPDTPVPVGNAGLGTPKGLWLSSERTLLFVDTALFSVGIVNLESNTLVRFAGSHRTGGNSRDDNGDKFGDGGDALLAMFNNPVGICANHPPFVPFSRFYITDSSHSAVRGLISTLTSAPSRNPTRSPTRRPTRSPTWSPTRTPTRGPTRSPTRSPTSSPTGPPVPQGTIIGFPSNYYYFLPYAVWGDDSGNLYVTDPHNDVIWKTEPNVLVPKRAAGGGGGFNGDNGPANLALLNFPKGIYGEPGFFYFADFGNSRIRAVNLQTNIISTIAGGGTQSPSSQSQLGTAVKLSDVTAVWVDSSTHNIYITTAEGLLRITPARNIELVFPVAATIEYLTGDNLGNLYFRYDQGISAIFKYDFNGLPTRIIGQSLPNDNGVPFEDGLNALSAHLGKPAGLWFDTQANRLFFADRGASMLGFYDPMSKTVSRVAGKFKQCGGTGHDLGNEFGDNGPARDGFLCIPSSIWGNSNHNIFIMDDGHDGLREIIFT